MISVLYVPPSQLDQEWADAGPVIDLARRRFDSKMDLEHLYEDLRKSYQQLWLVKDEGKTVAALVTIVENHPKAKVFRIMLIGGRNMRQWLHDALCVMKDAAKKLDCDTIEADGRLGWTKYAPECGFKEIARTYELEI